MRQLGEDVGVEMTKTVVPGGGQSRGYQAYGGACVKKVANAESRMVYRGPELSYLAITLHVARSFTYKPKGSNSIEHELLVVNDE
jgi:hypothetical protein